jgi:hypothetical protein
MGSPDNLETHSLSSTFGIWEVKMLRISRFWAVRDKVSFLSSFNSPVTALSGRKFGPTVERTGATLYGAGHATGG